ncbi:MAG: membrane protein insertion efficiency factor YidD [Rhodospirillaceae bacterium]
MSCGCEKPAKTAAARPKPQRSTTGWVLWALGRPLAWPMMGVILVYRYTLSPYLGMHCRFDPTCSAYGLQAIRLHGPIWGGWLTIWRLLRCHPWGGMGYDPVPETGPGEVLRRQFGRDRPDGARSKRDPSQQ